MQQEYWKWIYSPSASSILAKQSSFQGTVESNYAIVIATLSDWLKNRAPVFSINPNPNSQATSYYDWWKQSQGKSILNLWEFTFQWKGEITIEVSIFLEMQNS